MTFLSALKLYESVCAGDVRPGRAIIRCGWRTALWTQPGQLLARNVESPDTLNQDLAALAMAPRVSLSNARTQVERRERLEASYQYVRGSRTYSAGIYHEAVSNAAFLMSGPSDFLPASELLTPVRGRRARFLTRAAISGRDIRHR